jgi:hypothetical protein
MHREYHVVLLSDPTAILGESRTKKCFGLKSKVPFITDRLQPNLQRLGGMRRVYHVVLLSDPTPILGELRTKYCFDFMSKVPFITERLQPNLQCF